jgi:hypothetical protein
MMDKACNFQEKSVGFLVNLKNTNIHRHVLSHFNKLRDYLKNKPPAFADLCNALKYFKGPAVTESAITPCPNHWQCNPTTFLHTYTPIIALLSLLPLSLPSPLQEVEDTLHDAAGYIEDNLREQLDSQKPRWIYSCPNVPHKCFKCGCLGHIYSQCYIEKSYQLAQFKACL